MQMVQFVLVFLHALQVRKNSFNRIRNDNQYDCEDYDFINYFTNMYVFVTYLKLWKS